VSDIFTVLAVAMLKVAAHLKTLTVVLVALAVGQVRLVVLAPVSVVLVSGVKVMMEGLEHQRALVVVAAQAASAVTLLHRSVARVARVLLTALRVLQ
jgi:hypothetical protein